MLDGDGKDKWNEINSNDTNDDDRSRIFIQKSYRKVKIALHVRENECSNMII